MVHRVAVARHEGPIHRFRKVVRQALRLAFLSPQVISAILEVTQPQALSLAQIPKLLPLSSAEHRPLLSWSEHSCIKPPHYAPDRQIFP
jgi:hypothetical protein